MYVCMCGRVHGCCCMQENLLLSMFPKDVAEKMQKDLYKRQGIGSRLSQFRELYMNRFDNVRLVIICEVCINLSPRTHKLFGVNLLSSYICNALLMFKLQYCIC